MCLWILEYVCLCMSYAQTVFFKKNHEKGSLNFVKYIENNVGFQCKEFLHYWTNILSIIQNLCYLNCHEETLSGRGVEAVHCWGRDVDVRVFYSGRKTAFICPSPLQAAGVLGVRPTDHSTKGYEETAGLDLSVVFFRSFAFV